MPTYSGNLPHSKQQNISGGLSLVPRPSHCPVFDRLQNANRGGGRPGPFCHVNDEDPNQALIFCICGLRF